MSVILIILALIIGNISTNPLEPPTLTIVATSAGIDVSWTPVVIPNCFILYIMIHQIRRVEQSIRVTEDTYMSFPFTPCAEHTFILESVCRTGADSVGASIGTIVTGISDYLQVENLSLTHEGNSLSASWSRPEDAIACEGVKYQTSLSISDQFQIEKTTEQNSQIFEVEVIPPCALITLTVTPVDDHGSGASKAVFLTAESGADVGGIQDLVINNGRVEWAKSQGNGYCKVEYRVTIEGDSGNTEEFWTKDRFIEFDFVQCQLYSVSVTSIVDESEINTLNAYHRPVPSSVGQAENLQITEINGEVIVSWSPVVVGTCHVQYNLRYYIDGNQEGTALIPNTSYKFSTYHCAENLIIVQVIVDMTIGEETEASVTSSSAEPGKVTNIVADLTDNSFVVSWDPVVVGRCAIAYLVEHRTRDGTTSNMINVPIITMNRIPCSQNEVRVTAIAGSYRGPSSSVYVDIDIEDLARVEDLTVAEVEEGLLVSWVHTMPRGHCTIIYSISNFDGENVHEYETELISYTVSKTNCANNTITVVATEANSGVTSPPNIYAIEVDIDLAKVTNLKLNQLTDDTLQINWDKPKDSENCDIEYLVNIRVDDEENTFEVRTSDTSLETIIDIKPCHKFEVSVTPISPKGRKGVTLTEKGTAHLFSVQPVKDLVKDQGGLSWERPHRAGVCQLYYRVTVMDEKETIIKEVETFETSIDFEMEPCRRYISHVKAIDVHTNLVSETIVVEGVGTPRFIEHMTSIEYEIDRSTLKLSWSPALAGDCLVIYDIVHTIDNERIPFVTIENSIALDTIPCSTNNITITPVLQQDLVVGNPFTTSIFVGLDVLGPVEDIFVENSLLVWWSLSLDSGNCPLTYFVDIFDNTGLLIERVETKEIYIEWNFSACSQYLLRITPQHDEVIGVPTVVRFNAPEAAPAAPKHIRTIPSLFSAEIKFEATPFAENTCAIKEIRVICDESFGSEANIDMSFPIQDNMERIFDLKLTGLAQNIFYRCKAQWTGAQTSELSEIFEFLTVELNPTSVEVTNVTSNEVTVSWEIQTAEIGRIISHFIVEVITVGPNHFLQESCDVKKDFAQNFTLPSSSRAFTFTDASPNFRYHLSLIVVYTVGLDIRTQLTIANTLPGVPGPITDLTYGFALEDCAEYVGSGSFQWTLPCDINGELERFIVDLNVFHNTIGTVRSDTVVTTLRPDGNQYIFSVPIPVLNPFFNYSISIITDAAYRAIEPVELRAAPPKAYMYCPAA